MTETNARPHLIGLGIPARLALFCWLLIGPYAIAAELPLTSTQVIEYQTCIQKASDAPEDALDMATDWRTKGGGVAAKHCMALALISLKKYAEAAKQLESVAQDLQTGRGTFGLPGVHDPNLLPEVYGQAGNAWLLAGNMSRAYDLLSTAIAGVPAKSALAAEFLIDRSRALAGLGKYQKAIDDLGKAQKILPKRADIYVYRAAAERALGQLDAARRDLITALSIDPDNPDALLENGNINHLMGNDEAARVDWRQVLAKYPDSPEGAAAAKNLSLLNGDKITIPSATRP